MRSASELRVNVLRLYKEVHCHAAQLAAVRAHVDDERRRLQCARDDAEENLSQIDQELRDVKSALEHEQALQQAYEQQVVEEQNLKSQQASMRIRRSLAEEAVRTKQSDRARLMASKTTTIAQLQSQILENEKSMREFNEAILQIQQESPRLSVLVSEEATVQQDYEKLTEEHRHLEHEANQLERVILEKRRLVEEGKEAIREMMDTMSRSRARCESIGVCQAMLQPYVHALREFASEAATVYHEAVDKYQEAKDLITPFLDRVLNQRPNLETMLDPPIPEILHLYLNESERNAIDREVAAASAMEFRHGVPPHAPKPTTSSSSRNGSQASLATTEATVSTQGGGGGLRNKRLRNGYHTPPYEADSRATNESACSSSTRWDLEGVVRRANSSLHFLGEAREARSNNNAMESTESGSMLLSSQYPHLENSVHWIDPDTFTPHSNVPMVVSNAHPQPASFSVPWCAETVPLRSIDSHPDLRRGLQQECAPREPHFPSTMAKREDPSSGWVGTADGLMIEQSIIFCE